ncbi:MFS transporter [Opitutus sp. GAS368]|jgi:predicted MFS family arabinose efflux permease|uniref:MFS transporter n=1 Tax=Opitutus sp. GAS368 TaxID=1882749 RepID=UPI000879BABB|nr:MFS transporter [Opitutus sp. GAS368]SDR95373.1 Predicted arabinose efflux permease, MFS family [Opitutus sp. GAS368]
MTAAAHADKKLHYAWIAAGVTFFTLLAAAGARATSGVILLPFGNEFQWSRSTVSTIVAINIFLYGLIGPFAAALYQRFGLRRTMVAAMALLSAGYGLSTVATHYWQFVILWGVVVGIGSGMAAAVLGAAVANKWFTEKRGLVMGLLTASTATGQLIFLPVLASAVTTYHNWRAAPWIVAGATLLAIPVIWWLMRDGPRDVGLRPYGETGPVETAAPAAVGNPAKRAMDTLIEAMRVRDFWLLAGSFFVCGASTNGLIGTHLISAAFDCGIPEVRAASLLALMGLFDLVGTTASGWLSDRYNCRYLLFMYYGLRGVSLLFLPSALLGPTAGLGVFALFYGLDWIATVPPTVKLTGEVFGREKASIVFGWIAAAHQVGAACAAYAAGALRTATGTYTLAFFSAGALCVVAALIVLPIGKGRALAPQPA